MTCIAVGYYLNIHNVALGKVVVCEIKRKKKLLYQNSFNMF